MASQGIKRDFELMHLEIADMYNRLDMWEELDGVNLADYYPTQYETVKSVPNAVITKNKYGDVIGMDMEIMTPKEFNPPAVINSNVPNTTYSGSGGGYGSSGYRMNGSGGGTSPNVFSSGAKATSTGTKVLTAASTVSWAMLSASLGAKLGKAINSNFGGQYAWEQSDWEQWIDGLDPVDQCVFRTLFGIDGDSATQYVPEDMLASMYLTLLRTGAYDSVGSTATLTDTSLLYNPNLKQPIPFSTNATGQAHYDETHNLSTEFQTVVASSESDVYFVNTRGTSATEIVAYRRIAVSDHPFTLTDSVRENGGSWSSRTVSSTRYTNKSGDVVYIAEFHRFPRWSAQGTTLASVPEPYGVQITGSKDQEAKDVATTILFGTRTTVTPIEGMENDPRATTYIDPNVITGTTPETVLPQLKQNYPELFGDSIYEDVPQEDGSIKRITYIPVPWPNKDTNGKPITGTPSQTDPQVDPDTATDTELKDFIDTLTDFFTNPPTTGTGGSPATVVPAGSASSLWKIYNPTQAQVDAFGSWLWSSNFVEQLKKLFNDPMQAIIGIHKVFATPSIGGTATIKVGYLDSEVPSDWVDDQYTTIDCGTVNLRECFGNVFDYAPYTRVSLYLPFIGIVDLDVADVMRSSINIIYHVDVLTGACLADVKVIRDACGGVLYQYSGSAIVTYPVSSGNYMGMVAGVLSVASGIAGTVLSGGALAPALIGGAVGASHLHTDVSHSGGFSGCAGAMGGKKPYLIISRPQPALAGNFEHFTGLPANAHVTLANCSGMTRVKSVYVKSIHRATDEEKDMIESQLKAGVLV